MTKKQTAQELLRLCCAVCGPLTRGELTPFCSPTELAELLPGSSLVMRLSRQPDYTKLKKIYDNAAALRRLCEAVAARRMAELPNVRMPIAEHVLCIASARYALLAGRASEFQRLHRLYKAIPRLSVRPEEHMAEFWTGVLGPAWLGVEMLPAGLARDELLMMCAARYMLLPAPKDMQIEAGRLPTLAAQGWGLLRADMELKPCQSASAEESDDAETLAARAYWNLWAGSWENSHRAFSRLFRTREARIRSVAEPHGAALLIMAVIVAIRSHAPLRTVQQWLHIARELALRPLPSDDEPSFAEVVGFFDALSFWDAVENRGSRPETLPACAGALSAIPLAMGARSISRNTGALLPFATLVESIVEVHRRGLRLLAFYAACSLAQMPGIEAPLLEKLQPVQEGCSFKPLYAKATRKRHSPPDPHWEQLASLVEAQSSSTPRWLYWDVALDRYGSLARIEPRLVERRPHGIGKAVEPFAVLDSALLHCQDRRDLAVAALAHALNSEQMQGIPLLAEALVGHPRVRVVEGSYRRLVRVESVMPVIRASIETFVLKLSLDISQFRRLTVDDATLLAPAFSARMQPLVDYFSHGPVMLSLSQTERVRWLLARLAEFFTIEGDLPESIMEYQPRRPQFIVHASVYDNGYLFDLDVLHHSECSAFAMPGQGERVLLLTPGGEPTCIVRDFEEETSAACALVKNCPVLASVENEDFQWLFLSEADALQALQELAEAEVRVQWQASPALALVEPSSSRMRLSVLKEGACWLEIGAELEVDEQLTLILATLLELYDKRVGHFLPLGEKRFLHLSSSLEAQLQQLADSLHREQGRYVLPVAAIPGFASLWQGAPLPPALEARCAMLRECELASAPPGFTGELRDYQLAGFRWLLARARARLGACLADDMGLGKTVQTLAVLLQMASTGPSLVVTPASLCSNWVAEAARFAPGLRFIVYKSGAPPVALGGGEVLLATYGQMISNEPFFRSVMWNVLALDEAQAIKNPASRRAQVAGGLSASFRLCLSGTPVENSPVDLWSIMHFLNPSLLGPKVDYTRPDDAALERLRRLTAPLILRRRRDDVLPQLPPFSEKNLSIELAADERALYESCRRRALQYARSGKASARLLAELTRLRRLCCHGKLALESFAGESTKLKIMARLVEELLAADHSVLIFSQFTDVLDLAQQTLEAMGVCVLRLDGATPPSRRGERVRLFQEGAARVFLISLRAGGVGLNLTAADYVILLDPWWNPAVEAQAASRSYRYGQTRPVTFCRLIARDTVEERIMQMQDAKLALAESVIHEGALPLELLRELLKRS